MEAGLRLKNVREKLGLRYREVQSAAEQIADRHGNNDFLVGLSRLADIENKGVVPNLHRLYSLCAIYRLDLNEVLGWYGVPMEDAWKDGAHVEPAVTHLLSSTGKQGGSALLPLQLDPGIDLHETTFLSRAIREWGRVPLSLLETLDIDRSRFGVIGYDDERMYPVIRPGALVRIDDTIRKISTSGWTNDFERPIYFLEMREGYACSWCSIAGDQLILQPPSGSPVQPEIFPMNEVDVVGQVTGVAMDLARPDDIGTIDRIKTRARSVKSPG